MRKRNILRRRFLAWRRIPMTVSEYRVYGNDDTYAVCPRCRATMEREYVSYCSGCGQCLDWWKYPSLFREEQE